MAQLEHFEEKLFTSFSREAVGVRQRLCYNDEADDTSVITEANKHWMVEIFVSYRILDLLARENGIAGLVPVPSHLKIENLGIVPGIVRINDLKGTFIDSFLKGWKHLADWKRLLHNFQGLMASTLQGLPSETNTSHLTTLGLLLSRNAGNKVLLNIYVAAMHLADILGGVGNSTRRFSAN
jgi:hypothetical protein